MTCALQYRTTAGKVRPHAATSPAEYNIFTVDQEFAEIAEIVNDKLPQPYRLVPGSPVPGTGCVPACPLHCRPLWLAGTCRAGSRNRPVTQRPRSVRPAGKAHRGGQPHPHLPANLTGNTQGDHTPAPDTATCHTASAGAFDEAPQGNEEFPDRVLKFGYSSRGRQFSCLPLLLLCILSGQTKFLWGWLRCTAGEYTRQNGSENLTIPP